MHDGLGTYLLFSKSAKFRFLVIANLFSGIPIPNIQKFFVYEYKTNKQTLYFPFFQFESSAKCKFPFRLTDIDLEAMETILKENQLLKQQLHSCYMKVAKTQKV